MAGQTAELGTAYISVVPETGNLAKGIKEALAQSEKNAPKSGNAIGQGLTAGINKTLKAGVVGVGVAAGGILAGSISKGLGRLTGIDNAKAKLAGLGHEAESVTSIMDDALASVKGTAFGLEEAATIAASGVAAGIKPGEDLQRTLKLTADAATIAGTDLASMGSIINKVATSDMMQMDVANQLMDAGIPILQMVADEMGVTAEEARKLASEGKINFETFQSALEEGLGGAALKSGETVQGAFANMGAAMGRFGAKLTEPVFNAAPAVFGAVGDAFDTLGEKLEPLIEDFAEWLAPRMEDFAENTIPKLVDGVMEAVDSFIEFGDWVKDNAEWIKPLAAGIGGAVAAIYAWNTATTIAKGVQAAFNTVLAVNPIMLMVTALAAVTAGLVYFFTQTETGKAIWEKLVESFQKGIQWVKDAFNGLKDLIVGGDFTGALRDAFGWEEDHPMVNGILKIRDVLTGIPDLVSGITDILFKGDFTGLPFGLEEDSGFVAFLFGLRDAVIKVGDIVKAVFDAIWQAVQVTLGVIGTVILAPLIVAWNLFSDAIKAGWENWIKPVLEWMSEKWDWLRFQIEKAIFAIRYKFHEMQFALQKMWHEYVQPILDWISDKWDWLKFQIQKFIFEIQRNIYLFQSAVSALWAEYISPILTWISDKWDELKNRLITAYNNIKTAVIDAFSNALTWFRDNVVTPVINFFVEKWDWLKTKLHEGWTWIDNNVISSFRSGLEGFKSFFDGIVDGIGSVWDSLRGKLAKPINFMINKVYNEGIAEAWDTIASVLPLEPNTAKRVKPIAGYAAGGQVQRDPTGAVRGPGTGTSDSILARIANGEHIWTAREVAKAGGHGVLYAMRDLVESGRPFSFDGRGGLVGLAKKLDLRAGDLTGAAPGLLLPGFAKGGEVRPLWETQLERAHKWASARHGRPYVFGGSAHGTGGTDCSGFMSGIADVIQGGNGARKWATMAFSGGGNSQMPTGPQGFVAGLGPGFSIGVTNGGPGGGHTAGTLSASGNFSTVNVESGGSPSMVKYGIGADGADGSYFRTHYHLPIGADGAFVSGGAGGIDFFGAVKKWVGDKLSSILDPIKALLPSGPPAWNDIPKGVYDKGTKAFREFAAGVVEDLGDKVSGVWQKITGLFDNGGWLMPGRMAANKSGKPEPILTAGQWASFSALVKALPGVTDAMYTAAREIEIAFEGDDAGYGSLAEILGNEEWAKTVIQSSMKLGKLSASVATDVMRTAVRELEIAFEGDDAGYGALAEVLGNEEWAKAVIQSAMTLGELSASVNEWRVEMEPVVRKSAEDYAMEQGSSLLSPMGLEGVIPLAQKVGARVWDAYHAQPAEPANASPTVVEIEATGGDFVHVDDLEAVNDRVDGLEVKVNRKPAAATVTRGGAL